MSNQRNHYLTTTDGVTIGASVHGEGPPLVFLQGSWAMATSTGPGWWNT